MVPSATTVRPGWRDSSKISAPVRLSLRNESASGSPRITNGSTATERGPRRSGAGSAAGGASLAVAAGTVGRDPDAPGSPGATGAAVARAAPAGIGAIGVTSR
jgi:hypothetical protein